MAVPIDPSASVSLASPAASQCLGRLMRAATLRGITIPDIDPQRPIVGQYIAHAPEHLDHRGDVRLRRLLQPNLTGVPVVAQPEVRRRSHASLHLYAVRRPSPHGVAAVAKFNNVHAATLRMTLLTVEGCHTALPPGVCTLR